MKELINTLSDPIYSFTFLLFIFAWFMKGNNYRIVGSVKFIIGLSLFTLVVALISMTDPNFFAIISTPDNIPISILLISVTFFTWHSLHTATINDERIERGEPPLEATPEMREKVWCWPNLVYVELLTIIGMTIFLIVWAIIFKAPLEEPANPTWAPNPAKAPWYFLGLQEQLVYFDPWMAGVVIPVLIIVGLIAIPFIDTNPKGNGYYTFKERKLAMSMFLFGWVALWVYLIIIGTFLRGPNWTFYGPFEFWDFHKVVAGNNVNLSEYLWIKGLGVALPKNIFVREILGVVLTLAYFVGSIPFITKKWGKEIYERLGAARYYLFVLLVLTMMSLPIKMYLRWMFNLKYIIAMPEFEFNL